MSRDNSLKGMVYASLFGAATAAAAYLSVPMVPVPFTLQTLVLMLSAAFLGPRLGALSQVIYLLLGIMGLPVFAGGKAGLGVVTGPTGGYLIGFIPAAAAVGYLVWARRAPGFWWLVLSMAVGTLIVYVLGVFQLAISRDFGPAKAVAVGALPFLPGDALKIVAAAVLAGRLRRAVRFSGREQG